MPLLVLIFRIIFTLHLIQSELRQLLSARVLYAVCYMRPFVPLNGTYLHPTSGFLYIHLFDGYSHARTYQVETGPPLFTFRGQH